MGLILQGPNLVLPPEGGSLPATPADALLDAGSPSTIVGLNASGVGEALSASAARSRMGLGSLATASSVTASQISDSTTAGRAVLTAADAAAQRTALAVVPSSATPLVESGAGAVGTSADYARADHVHPAAGSSWLSLFGATGIYVGGESATGFAAADYATASAAAAVPAFGPGQSMVICLYPNATPASIEIIAAHLGGGGVRGWYVACGAYGVNRLLIGLWFYGLGAAGGLEYVLTGSELTVGSAYVIAITMKADKSTRYSVNGATVATVAAQTGTYTAPTSADTYDLGSTRGLSPATYPLTSALLGEVRTYSTEISDADLVAACAERTAGTIPTVATGTVSTRFLPSDFAGGPRVKAQTGVTWILKGGASVRPK